MEKEDYKVSLKEIRENLYELRNFEISHLWQRSVFLSALLVIFFSGYGFLVLELTEESFDKILAQDGNLILLQNKLHKTLVINEICCAIALLGVIYSIIWIMMAKGSKAWYEVYVEKIRKIEKEDDLSIKEDYRMGEHCCPKSIDENLFTTRAGRYSVSRLNILIGKFLMLLWAIIFIIHYIVALTDLCLTSSKTLCPIHIIILTMLIILLFVVFITACCNLWAKSSTLGSPQNSDDK
ncbi:hypothetical protein CS544_00170 [Porphyromonas gingivalis]|uniref:RipA family octameric membrane protein n=1 Tax=Porphyromonas gingivalis TaxID=837 RepID=UPI000C19D9A0|nr:hypothetical protein [Porphyromonas gingivalis]ATR89684.1 hypothetical protein CS544_00170 [Porphyromonas gingivalis]